MSGRPEKSGATAATADGYRFYTDLADWWPLISPADDYRSEAGWAAALLGTAGRPVREVIELGSGGGHNAAHLKGRFDLTLVDLSPEMLAASQRLNPECAHRQGDMRTVRLGHDADAVFVHDAVDYMLDETDLLQAMTTAYRHCRAGGVAVFLPDHVAETFSPDTDHGGSDAPDGRGVRYLEWSLDPDPADTWIETHYAFLLREADGAVRTVHETHRTGLFPRSVWLRLLAAAGFVAESVPEPDVTDRPPREAFLGHRR